MNKILLLGKKGQLGWELDRVLRPLGAFTAYDFPEIDFAHPESLRPVVASCHPNVIVNAVAYTNVDKAESEPEAARLINSVSPGVLAEEAQKTGAIFIHYSTDYVFDGQKGSPYVETDAPRPVNVYGETKLNGERAIEEVNGAYLILRTSWVYSMRPGGFVSKVLQWARNQQTLKIVTDQTANPTWARMLAEITGQLLAKADCDPINWLGQHKGLYHLAGDGYASRYEWAKAILEYHPNPRELRLENILPALTAEFPSPANRPHFSALDCSQFAQIFQLILPSWQDALRLAMSQG